MKTVLMVVGKTVDKRLVSLIDDYTSRLKYYLPFSAEIIPELKNARALTFDQQKEREADMLLGRLETSDHVVLLDEGGREMRSIEFAAYLEKMQVRLSGRLVFVVGGPYGFSPRMYARAAEKISLSRLTFSHQMIRLLFVEQLYRAMTILRGEPYHHE
ncbi:MAG: 23S rRNA (pseudouridine(1915)-N(3))-methyltransferase RlmH [Prevotellaceae bacterium]|nr:23S rRNA (pseudouridine(1915)-N(3))-methyltransferase RlmH [Prevotellaceae bacterium]